MRVLYYINSLPMGGAERVVCENAIMLKQKGLEVFFLCLYPLHSYFEKQLKEHGVDILFVYKEKPHGHIGKLLFYLSGGEIGRKINGIVSSLKPDLIHINTNGKFLNQLSFSPNKMIYTFHSEVERSLRIGGRKHRRNIKSLSDKGMWFTALTGAMYNDLKARFKTDKICVIPNGIDIHSLKKNVYSKKRVVDELGLPQNSFLVGNVGRMHPVKNHERMIGIFAELLKLRSDAYLILIGGCGEKRKKELVQLSKRLMCSDRILFLGERQDATGIVNALDVFLTTTKSESFALAVLEAEILGVRCVVTDCIHSDILLAKNCTPLSLREPNETWARALATADLPATENETAFSKFDLKIVVDDLVNYYEHIASYGE